MASVIRKLQIPYLGVYAIVISFLANGRSVGKFEHHRYCFVNSEMMSRYPR